MSPNEKVTTLLARVRRMFYEQDSSLAKMIYGDDTLADIFEIGAALGVAVSVEAIQTGTDGGVMGSYSNSDYSAEEVAMAPVMTEPPLSSQILSQADQVIHGERAEAYGPAEDSFARIGELWSVHLGVPVDGYDVAIMMTLMKCARAKTDYKADTFIDICGYGALAPRCAQQAGRV